MSLELPEFSIHQGNFLDIKCVASASSSVDDVNSVADYITQRKYQCQPYRPREVRGNTEYLPSKGCLTKTKMIEARNSCAVAENNHESASTVPEAEEMMLAVDEETKLRKTRITITATRKVKTLSSLLTTLSRSFKLAIMAFRSRPISTWIQSVAY